MLRGQLAHPDWQLNPEAPSSWTFSLRQSTEDSPVVDKGGIGNEEVWRWRGKGVAAGSRGTLRLRLYLCSRTEGLCCMKRVRHEIQFVEREKGSDQGEVDLGLLF